MKISDFRKIVNGLNWLRNDLSGATSDEFIKMDVPLMLNERIDELKAAIPHVHARFSADLENANRAIEHAQSKIAWWHAKKACEKAKNAIAA